MNEANTLTTTSDVVTEQDKGRCAQAPRSALPMLRRHIMQAIASELDRAYAKHGQEQWSRHEFYGILKEEVDELWDAIKADESQERLRAEAIQVAAMVCRYLETGDRYREPNVPAQRPPATEQPKLTEADTRRPLE